MTEAIKFFILVWWMISYCSNCFAFCFYNLLESLLYRFGVYLFTNLWMWIFLLNLLKIVLPAFKVSKILQYPKAM
ncbi:hypothetical protein VNO77_06628 [Canavalia gladiata]|uniref:Uncharacterized protein n=1 Tax=Canavalia gladiata TaxID=3824 RepID=A0AAN9QVD3_CANGL